MLKSQLLSFSFVPEFLWISTWCVAFEDLLVYFTLSGRSYLSDFLIANRCGSNQAWMWLEKLNSGLINHSYVLTGGRGQTLFHTGPCGYGFCFPFIKKTLHLKTACCVYLCYLWLIFKFVWWSETLKCGKHAKKIKNQEGGQHFFTPLYIYIYIYIYIIYIVDKYLIFPRVSKEWHRLPHSPQYINLREKICILQWFIH